MNKAILGTLILVLFISGCTGLPDISSLLGGNPSTNVTKLGPDVITLQNINVIPKASLHPDDKFSVFFEVKNQDDKERVPTVTYNLFDTGMCGIEGGSPDPKVTDGVFDVNGFAPSETKLVEWNLKAPSTDQLAGLMVTCPIRFKVSYVYNAISQIDVDVIDSNALRTLQRSGKDVTYVPSLVVGRGPIKIYFDFGNSLPIENGGSLTAYIKVKDEGAGLFGEIPQNSFSIEVPDKFTVDSNSCINDYFTCTGKTCTNTEKAIPLINKETFDIRCTFKAPSTINNEQTFYITAKILNYEYPVFGETSVDVNP